MKKDSVISAIKTSRGKDTCHRTRKDFRKEECPEIGQCAITSLIIQDFFGGKILYCSHHHHYRNQTNNREIIDLTKNQFLENTEFCVDKIMDRKDMFENENFTSAQTEDRYKILKLRVEEVLNKK